MDLARVIGTVVATRRDPAFEHLKLAVVQPLDRNLKASGDPIVAVDALNRTRGDLVYIVRSGDAMFACRMDKLVPTDCAIGGLVDTAHISDPEAT
jgi:ethanolamine utilization protein EutN